MGIHCNSIYHVFTDFREEYYLVRDVLYSVIPQNSGSEDW
jgi:hypothetical protein